MLMPEDLLSGWSRIGCAIVSAATSYAGTYATFHSENELGTLALLLIAAFTGLCALLGRVPRVSVAGNAVDTTRQVVRVTEAAAEAAEVAVLEKKTPEEAGDAVRIAAGRAFRVTGPADDHRPDIPAAELKERVEKVRRGFAGPRPAVSDTVEYHDGAYWLVYPPDEAGREYVRRIWPEIDPFVHPTHVHTTGRRSIIKSIHDHGEPPLQDR